MLRRQFLLILPLLLIAAGCGKKPVPVVSAEVKGKVTLDGAPITNGKIVFDGGTGIPAGEFAIKDGAYSGLVQVGSKTVRIFSFKTVPQKGPMGKDQTMQENTLPAKHNTASKETREVKEGVVNEFNFDLK